MSAALPPLPTPKGKVYFEAEPYQPAWVSSSDAFDDDQMQAYASQARADLEAAIVRKDALLRQALEVLDAVDMGFSVSLEVYASIKKELAK